MNIEEKRERQKEYQRKYREANREIIKQRDAKYRFDNRELLREKLSDWKQTDSGKECHARYKQLSRMIDPSASAKSIGEIYELRDKLNSEIGENIYVVDHIIPLSKGGTTHENNLQILTAVENMQKHTDTYIKPLSVLLEEHEERTLNANRNRKI